MTWPEISGARATYSLSDGLPDDIELAHVAVAFPAAAAPQASTTTSPTKPCPEPAADAAADAAHPEAFVNIVIAQVLENLPEIDRVYLAREVRANMPALDADTGERVLGWLVESGAWPREGRAVDAGSAKAPSAAAAVAVPPGAAAGLVGGDPDPIVVPQPAFALDSVQVADRVLCHLSGSVTALPPASHA
jgi:hypothetical protein